MSSITSSTAVRKPIKTYSRLRRATCNIEEPPAKRRCIGSTSHSIRSEKTVVDEPLISSPSSPKECESSVVPTSAPVDPVIESSNAPNASTPPSSPPPAQSSPAPQQRKPIFSFFRRKSEPASTQQEPLSERNGNSEPPIQRAQKKKRLVQMQLDLGGDNRKTCQMCRMEYVPSNVEDAALHKKFHAKSVGGIDITKTLIAKMKENQIWTGADGSFITVIGRKDSPAFRNKAVEVLNVVKTELAAVSIPEETLWSQISVPDKPGPRPLEKSGKRSSPTSDRFKIYLYIRGTKCIGACLAERITEAFIVLGGDDASDQTDGPRTDLQGSSISVSNAPEAAVLGISRIWTSNLHRKSGVATTLLESARSDFLYGITVPKEQVAFSQPTESGGRLARKWFGRRSGWHVYVD